jgi:hypothetical protein
MTSGVRNWEGALVGGVREGKRKVDHVMSRVKTAMRTVASSIATSVCVAIILEEVEFHVPPLVVWSELSERVLRSSQLKQPGVGRSAASTLHATCRNARRSQRAAQTQPCGRREWRWQRRKSRASFAVFALCNPSSSMGTAGMAQGEERALV